MSTDTAEDIPVWATADTAAQEGVEPVQEGVDGPTDVPGMNPAFQNFIDWLAAKADGDDSDTMAALVDLVEEMATADSPAAVLAGGYPLHAEEVVGRPLGVYGVKIRQGEFEENENLGFYAVLDAELLDTMQRRSITCGGHKVMAKLYGLDVRNAWPTPMILVAIQTKNGRRRFDLKAVE